MVTHCHPQQGACQGGGAAPTCQRCREQGSGMYPRPHTELLQLLTLTKAQGGCWHLWRGDPGHSGKDPGTGHHEGVCGVRGYLRMLAWHKKEKIPVGRNGVSGNEKESETADRGRQAFTGKAWKELLGWVRDRLEEDSGVSIHRWQQDPAEKGWEETQPVHLLTRMNIGPPSPPSITLSPTFPLPFLRPMLM